MSEPVGTGSPGEWPRGLPEHVTTPLLARITAQSLDEDYRVVAERRATGAGEAPPPGRPRWVAASVIAAFGILITTAAVQTSARAEVVDASRSTLIGRIGAERDQVRAQQDEIATLQDETIELGADLEETTDDLQDRTTELRRLEVRTGFVAVRGPGVVVTVDDNPQGDVTQMVRDEDLALLVDGLWSAGAEAVAINDQRITALAGIHNRGLAIEVGGRAVNPPYVVRAIGDVDTLAADLFDTTHGERFFALADGLGFVHRLQNEDDLSLPGARDPLLRWVGRGTAGKPDLDDDKEATP